MKPLYTFWGKVKEGHKRGKTLNFPTANVALHTRIPSGIYASRTKVNNNFYNSLTFIGNATTFDEKTYQSETYIFDFDKSIYGKWITNYLLKKIRENEKFVSVERLVKKMEEDKKIALKYFKENK